MITIWTFLQKNLRRVYLPKQKWKSLPKQKWKLPTIWKFPNFPNFFQVKTPFVLGEFFVSPKQPEAATSTGHWI